MKTKEAIELTDAGAVSSAPEVWFARVVDRIHTVTRETTRWIGQSVHIESVTLVILTQTYCHLAKHAAAMSAKSVIRAGFGFNFFTNNCTQTR